MIEAYKNTPEYNTVPESKETRKAVFLRLLAYCDISEESREIGGLREGNVKNGVKYELGKLLATNEDGTFDFTYEVSLKAMDELKLLKLIDFADAWSRVDVIRAHYLTDETYQEELAAETFKFSPTKNK